MRINTIYSMAEQDKKQQVLSYDNLKQILCSIEDNEHRVFLKTTYACVARVGEIVNGKYSSNPPLQKDNFEVTKNLLLVTLLTEKTGRIRTVPCSRIDDERQEFFKKNEAWLTEDIINYTRVFDNKVWDKSTRWGQYVFAKYFPEKYRQHIHLLRHWRASHLLSGAATGKPVPDQVVAKLGGWIGTQTLNITYDGTIIEDYVKVNR